MAHVSYRCGSPKNTAKGNGNWFMLGIILRNKIRSTEIRKRMKVKDNIERVHDKLDTWQGKTLSSGVHVS